MNVIRRWGGLSLLVGVTLAGSVISASARQHKEDYIGSYQRTLPGRRGTVTIRMRIGESGRVGVRTIRPNGTEDRGEGTWQYRHKNITVTVDENGHVATREYHLHGSNLERIDDRHIFFKRI